MINILVKFAFDCSRLQNLLIEFMIIVSDIKTAEILKKVNK